MTPLAIFHADLRTAIIAAVVVLGAAALWAVDKYLSRPVEWKLHDDDEYVVTSLFSFRKDRD